MVWLISGVDWSRHELLLAEVVYREEIEIRFTPYKEAHVQG